MTSCPRLFNFRAIKEALPSRQGPPGKWAYGVMIQTLSGRKAEPLVITVSCVYSGNRKHHRIVT